MNIDRYTQNDDNYTKLTDELEGVFRLFKLEQVGKYMNN